MGHGRRQVRYWEWGTFGVLLGLVCGVLTLLPMPRGGRSQAVPERLFFLPIVPPTLEVDRAPDPEEGVEEDPALSGEEMAAMLAEAFGAESAATEQPLAGELASRTSEVLTVEGLDLSAWDTGDGAGGPGRGPERPLDLRRRSSRRHAPTLIQPDVGGGSTGGLRMRIEGRPDTVAPQLETHAVARRAPVTMDDFTEVVEEDLLAQWIQAHPSVLDPGIRSLFGAGPDVPTARAAAHIDGQAYEVFLMLVPVNGEVRIALVEGETLYYFVSPKVRRQASYFQIGTVRREANGRIVTVESEDRSPQADQARTFYGRFVDWWRTQDS